MQRTVQFAVERGDITDFAADLVALKYAQDFYGPTRALRDRLANEGVSDGDFRPAPDAYTYLRTRGVIGAPGALIVGVPELVDFKYAQVRKFTQTMFRGLHDKAPGIRHLAMTIHGPKFGLDAQEAFLAQFLVCLAEAQVGGLPLALERISVVERDPQRVQQIKDAADKFIGAHRGVRPLEPPDWGYHLPVGDALTGGTPHVFVAMPFSAEMDDVFYFGIQRPILAAGLLCERVDRSSHFRGSIVERIKERIGGAALVVADITGGRPNVFYEAGYASALGKEPLLLVNENDAAQKQLDFDIRTDRCLFYKDIEDLRVKLSRELSQVLTERNINPRRGAGGL